MAATSSQQLVAAETDMLTCQICLNPLVHRSPRQLRCLHTYCTPCLDSIVEKATQDRDFVTCPTCRKRTELPEGQVKNLPLKSSVEQTNGQISLLRQDDKCSTCWGQGNFVNATVNCITCGRRLCDSCCERHNTFPGFALHSLETVKTESICDSSCKRHSNVFKYFCSACKALVCTDCLLSGGHDFHPNSVSSLQQTAGEIKIQLIGKRDLLTKQISQLRSILNEHEKQNERFQRVKIEIASAAERAKASIDKNMEELLKELESKSVNPTEQNIRLITSIIETRQEIFQTLENNERNDIEIVQQIDTLREVENTLKAADELLKKLNIPPTVQFVREYRSKVGILKYLNDSSHEKYNVILESNKLSTESTPVGTDVKTPNVICNFPNCRSECTGGIGALSRGSAIVVSDNEEDLILCDLFTGHSSTLSTSRNVTCISAYENRVLCWNIYEKWVSEVQLCSNKILFIKDFDIPVGNNSRITLDSSGNVLISDAIQEADVYKYSPDGKLLWKKNLSTDDFVEIEVVSNKKCDTYIISYENCVKLLDENGKEIGELSIAQGKMRPHVTSTTSTPTGTILVADSKNHTVSEYNTDGTFRRHVLTQNDGIKNPMHIACDSTWRCWVNQYNCDKGPTVYQLR